MAIVKVPAMAIVGVSQDILVAVRTWVGLQDNHMGYRHLAVDKHLAVVVMAQGILVFTEAVVDISKGLGYRSFKDPLFNCL